MVRRHVVVSLIRMLNNRGRRAYRNIGMSKVEEKSLNLPENAVPPEIIKLLPLDGLLDKIQMQKSATPLIWRP